MAVISPNTPMMEKKKKIPAKPCMIPHMRRAKGEVLFIRDSRDAALLHEECAEGQSDRNHPIVVLIVTSFVISL